MARSVARVVPVVQRRRPGGRGLAERHDVLIARFEPLGRYSKDRGVDLLLVSTQYLNDVPVGLRVREKGHARARRAGGASRTVYRVVTVRPGGRAGRRVSPASPPQW